MAIFLSQLMTAGSGKIGGIVLTRNRYAGLIIRAWTMPVNPSTNAQEKIRALLSEAVEKWQLLTPLQRSGWNLFASYITFQNPLGEDFHPTGQNMYIGTYTGGMYFDDLLMITGDFDQAPHPASGMLPQPDVGFKADMQAPSVGIPMSIYNSSASAIMVVVQLSQRIPNSRDYWTGPYLPGAELVVPIAAGISALADITVGAAAGERYGLRISSFLQDPPIRYSSKMHLTTETVETAPKKSVKKVVTVPL